MSTSSDMMDDIMDRRVLKYRSELEKAKYKLWVQDQKQVRVYQHLSSLPLSSLPLSSSILS